MRNRLLIAVSVFVLCALSAHAQAPQLMQPNGTPHSTSFPYTLGAPISGVTVSGVNFYCGPTSGSEGVAPNNVAINAALVTSSPFVWNGVVPGQTYFCVAEEQSSTGNLSKPSNEVTFTTPINPNPPSLSAVIVSINFTGGTETVVAEYKDSDKTSITDYTLWGSGRILQTGRHIGNGSGSYTVRWSGPSGDAVSPVLTVADAGGQVASSGSAFAQ